MSDSAPPYEEFSPSPVRGYAPVSQDDEHDLNHNHEEHAHASHPPQLLTPPSEANIGLVPPGNQGHSHCEACDRLLERQHKRRAQQHCCALVAVTFMVAIVCSLVLGIVVARTVKH